MQAYSIPTLTDIAGILGAPDIILSIYLHSKNIETVTTLTEMNQVDKY